MNENKTSDVQAQGPIYGSVARIVGSYTVSVGNSVYFDGTTSSSVSSCTWSVNGITVATVINPLVSFATLYAACGNTVGVKILTLTTLSGPSVATTTVTLLETPTAIISSLTPSNGNCPVGTGITASALTSLPLVESPQITAWNWQVNGSTGGPSGTSVGNAASLSVSYANLLSAAGSGQYHYLWLTVTNSAGSNSTYVPFYLIYSATVNLLIVGGGGGGGLAATSSTYSGGGGGGDVQYYANRPIGSGTYSVVIGTGGVASYGVNTSTTSATSTTFNSLIANGGGVGSCNTGGNGSSGGGGGRYLSGIGFYSFGTGGIGSQGYNGGASSASSNAGGGGGKGGAGQNGAGSGSGVGGAGISSNITGSIVYYGAGGGGGSLNTVGYLGGAGGSGVGGAGANYAVTRGQPGIGYGNGGGGGSYSGTPSTQWGGSGSNGVVIIAYDGTKLAMSGLGIQSGTGANSLLTITTSGTLTVTELLPTAVISSLNPSNGYCPANGSGITASASTSVGGIITAWNWQINSSTVAPSGTSLGSAISLSSTYASLLTAAGSSGLHYLWLTVTNASGPGSTYVPITLIVAPTVTTGSSYSVTFGNNALLTCVPTWGTSATANSTTAYVWKIGANTVYSGTLQNPSIPFNTLFVAGGNSVGIKTLTLTVMDNYGQIGTATPNPTVTLIGIAPTAVISSKNPSNGYCPANGSGITASASTSIDGGIPITTWNWRINNSTVAPSGTSLGSSVSLSSSYASLLTAAGSSGLHYLWLTVTNSIGSNSVYTPITLITAPTATTTGPYSVANGYNVTLTGVPTWGTSATANSTTAYVWRIGANIIYSGTLASVSVPFNSFFVVTGFTGVKTLTLTVMDNYGQTYLVTTSVNLTPYANAGLSDYISTALAPVVFDGSGSTGIGLTYEWFVNGFSVGTGVSPSVLYSTLLSAAGSTGTKILTLIVTDAWSTTKTNITNVTLIPAPIAVNTGGKYTAIEGIGSQIMLDGSGSVGNNLTYNWIVNSISVGTGVNPYVGYTTLYNAIHGIPFLANINTLAIVDVSDLTLTVTDTYGQSTSIIVVDGITLQDSIPLSPIYILQQGVYPTVTFSSSGSYDPDGNIVIYEWRIGTDLVRTNQALIASTANATFNWNDPLLSIIAPPRQADYQLNLWVKDNEGIWSTETAIFRHMIYSLPVAIITDPHFKINSGQSLILNGTSSTGELSHYWWSVSNDLVTTILRDGDLSGSITETIEIPYSELILALGATNVFIGSFVLTLIVEDNAGAFDPDSLTLSDYVYDYIHNPLDEPIILPDGSICGLHLSYGGEPKIIVTPGFMHDWGANFIPKVLINVGKPPCIVLFFIHYNYTCVASIELIPSPIINLILTYKPDPHINVIPNAESFMDHYMYDPELLPASIVVTPVAECLQNRFNCDPTGGIHFYGVPGWFNFTGDEYSKFTEEEWAYFYETRTSANYTIYIPCIASYGIHVIPCADSFMDHYQYEMTGGIKINGEADVWTDYYTYICKGLRIRIITAYLQNGEPCYSIIEYIYITDDMIIHVIPCALLSHWEYEASGGVKVDGETTLFEIHYKFVPGVIIGISIGGSAITNHFIYDVLGGATVTPDAIVNFVHYRYIIPLDIGIKVIPNLTVDMVCFIYIDEDEYVDVILISDIQLHYQYTPKSFYWKNGKLYCNIIIEGSAEAHSGSNFIYIPGIEKEDSIKVDGDAEAWAGGQFIYIPGHTYLDAIKVSGSSLIHYYYFVVPCSDLLDKQRHCRIKILGSSDCYKNIWIYVPDWDYIWLLPLADYTANHWKYSTINGQIHISGHYKLVFVTYWVYTSDGFILVHYSNEDPAGPIYYPPEIEKYYYEMSGGINVIPGYDLVSSWWYFEAGLVGGIVVYGSSNIGFYYEPSLTRNDGSAIIHVIPGYDLVSSWWYSESSGGITISGEAGIVFYGFHYLASGGIIVIPAATLHFTYVPVITRDHPPWPEGTAIILVSGTVIAEQYNYEYIPALLKDNGKAIIIVAGRALVVTNHYTYDPSLTRDDGSAIIRVIPDSLLELHYFYDSWIEIHVYPAAEYSTIWVYEANVIIIISGTAGIGFYYLTTSGGIIIGGTIVVDWVTDWQYDSTGGIIIGGNIVVDWVTDWQYDSTGGIIIGGNIVVDWINHRIYDVHGGIIIDGNIVVDWINHRIYGVHGGIIIGGNIVVDWVSDRIYDTHGGIIIGGTAIIPYVYTMTGGIIIGGNIVINWITYWQYDSTGGIIIGGTAIIPYVYTMTGGIIIGGTAIVNHYVYKMTGGIVIGGTAIVPRVYIATGGIIIGGTAIIPYVYTMTGGIIIGGTIVISGRYVYSASGGIIISGEAGIGRWNVPDGGIIIGGSIVINWVSDRIYDTHGGIIIGGEAGIGRWHVPTGGIIVIPCAIAINFFVKPKVDEFVCMSYAGYFIPGLCLVRADVGNCPMTARNSYTPKQTAILQGVISHDNRYYWYTDPITGIRTQKKFLKSDYQTQFYATSQAYVSTITICQLENDYYKGKRSIAPNIECPVAPYATLPQPVKKSFRKPTPTK